MASRVIGLATLVAFLFAQNPVYAYDLAKQSGKKKSSPVTVALVPYSESYSAEIDQLIQDLSYNLQQEGKVRVLDHEKTQAILGYYLNYVEKTASDRALHKRFTEARQSLLDGDFAAAERGLDVTESLIRKRMAAGGSNEGLYEVHLLKAKIHHAGGDEEAVRASYAEIVRLYPDLELEKDLYSKWERKALKKAQEEIEEDSLGKIKIKSDPKGSEVIVNGVHRGITPLTVKDFPPGLHCVEIKTVHHASFIRYVTVQEDKTTKIDARLRRVSYSHATKKQTIRPSHYKTDLEISRMISVLGYHLGVDKVILVARQDDSEGDALVYRMGDTELGAVQQVHHVYFNPSDPIQTVGVMSGQADEEARQDLLKNPAEYANAAVGSVKLHERRKNPIYKKPLFWVIVGAIAVAGGVTAALLATGGGATTGGIIIGVQ